MVRVVIVMVVVMMVMVVMVMMVVWCTEYCGVLTQCWAASWD